MLAALSQTFREKPLVVAAWLFTAALACRFAVTDLGYALSHDGWRAGPGAMLGRDFANVFTAGHLFLDGKLSIIYDIAGYRDYQGNLFDGRVIAHNYSYSPVSFFYVPLFALGGYGFSYFLWIGVTGLAFMLAARPYLREAGLPAWPALLIPAAVANVWAGHYGFLFGALWLTAWHLVEKRPRTAGILIGLMIVKPHLALLMPLALLRRGAWTPIVYAALTVLSLVALSGLAFGWDAWTTYLTQTSAFQAAMIDEAGEFYLRMMPTTFPAILLTGLGSGAAWIAQGATAIGAIAALLRWMPRDPMRAGLATATATFLVLPYAFNYDLTVVGIAALIALHRGNDADSIAYRCAGLLAFLLPLLVINLNDLGIPIAPPVMAGLLAVLLRAEYQQSAESRAPALAPA